MDSKGSQSRRGRRSRLVLLPWLGVAGPALAAEPADEDILEQVEELSELSLGDLLNMDIEVESATKTATRAEDVAAFVTVVTREQILAWGYRSVAELLQHELGFYVVDDFIVPNVGVRGISGSLWGESGNVKVMIDEHSVSFRSTGGNWLGPELVPLSAVDHVEIIRGPASSLYGADAFLGVVNIVTRRPDGDDDEPRADVRGGANRVTATLGYDADGAVSSDLGPITLLASARVERTDLSGLAVPDTSPAPFVPDHVDDERLVSQRLEQESAVGLVKLDLDTAAFDRFTLSGYFSAIERDAEFGPWLQLGNGYDALGRTSENRVALAHGHVAGAFALPLGEQVSLQLDSAWFRGGPTADDRLEVRSDTFYVQRRFGFEGTDNTLELHWGPRDDLSLIAGGSLLYDDEDLPSVLKRVKTPTGDLAVGEVVPEVSTRQGTRAFFNPAAYLAAQWQPWERRLGFQGSVRFDHHNIYGRVAAARIGAVAEPTEDLTFKLVYGSAFKAPSALLLYGVPLRPGDIVGNADLQSQYVHAPEAMASLVLLDAIRVQTGVAANILLDKAEFRQQGGNRVARNVSVVRAVSWESAIEGQATEAVGGYARLNVTDARHERDDVGYEAELFGDENVGYPPVTVAAGLRLTPSRIVEATVEARYAASRRAQQDNILERGESYRLDPYVVVDATLATRAVELLDAGETRIALVGRNLFDDDTPDPGFAGVDYPRAPRSFLLTVRQTF